MQPLTTVEDPLGETPPSNNIARRAANDLALGLLPLLAVAAGVATVVGLGFDYVLYALTLYALECAVVLRSVPDDLPAPGIGLANRLTLGRSTLVVPLATLALYPATLGQRDYWWIIVVGTAALLLDGADGWLARRHATCTDFGGRFDMELDAFMVLALSVLVWTSSKVGPWVLLIGATRYLFVAAGGIWPRLRGELHPSWRRKVICVAQGIVLLICLGPVVPAALASALSAAALLLLLYSFAVDIRQLTLTPPS